MDVRSSSRDPGRDVSVQKGLRLEPWSKGDLALLHKKMGDPEMTKHLGGPESPEKIADRQLRYERLAESGKGRMFKIVYEATGEAIGSVGYWERVWRGEDVYEIGWSFFRRFKGEGSRPPPPRRRSQP